MPTANRRRFVPLAIRYFLAQDYGEKELVILDDGSDCVEDLIPDDPRIRYFRNDRRKTVGAKRNLACEAARSSVIVHWDDDDWSAPWRLRYQMQELVRTGSDVCGLSNIYFWDPELDRAWEYRHRGGRCWVHGATFRHRKTFCQANSPLTATSAKTRAFSGNKRTRKIDAGEPST